MTEEEKNQIALQLRLRRLSNEHRNLSPGSCCPFPLVERCSACDYLFPRTRDKGCPCYTLTETYVIQKSRAFTKKHLFSKEETSE